jgi:hypothetical protein
MTEGIYSDSLYFDKDYIYLDNSDEINEEINEEIEKMDFYENPKYFIKKALENWDKIVENTDPIFVSEWVPKYKKYLTNVLNHNDIILFNGLSTFKEVVSVCNSYHQKKLLQKYRFECNCHTKDFYNESGYDHYYIYFENPYNCSKGNKIVLRGGDSESYDYLGFISEIKPAGTIECLD